MPPCHVLGEGVYPPMIQMGWKWSWKSLSMYELIRTFRPDNSWNATEIFPGDTLISEFSRNPEKTWLDKWPIVPSNSSSPTIGNYIKFDPAEFGTYSASFSLPLQLTSRMYCGLGWRLLNNSPSITILSSTACNSARQFWPLGIWSRGVERHSHWSRDQEDGLVYPVSVYSIFFLYGVLPLMDRS